MASNYPVGGFTTYDLGKNGQQLPRRLAATYYLHKNLPAILPAASSQHTYVGDIKHGVARVALMDRREGLHANHTFTDLSSGVEGTCGALQ
jgi:hypothetical protein